MTRKPSEVLQAARALIEDPARWCKGSMFVLGNFGERVQMCAAGAMAECGCWSGLADHIDVYLETAGESFGRSVPSVNDELGHEAVMEMFDVAISMALSDEAVEP